MSPNILPNLLRISCDWEGEENKSICLERIFTKGKCEEIRLAWWKDGRLTPRPADIDAIDWLPLFNGAAAKGAFNAEERLGMLKAPLKIKLMRASMKRIDGILLVAILLAIVSIGWLATGTLLPYQAVRSGIYTVAAFLIVFSLSVVASYWIDIGKYEFRKERDPFDLKRRGALALYMIAGAAFIMRFWEEQENREFIEAKNAYEIEQYETAIDLFKQQKGRYWTTELRYREITRAIFASDAGRVVELRTQQY